MMCREILTHLSLAVIRVAINAAVAAAVVSADINTDSAIAPFALIFIAERVRSKQTRVNARYGLYAELV